MGFDGSAFVAAWDLDCFVGVCGVSRISERDQESKSRRSGFEAQIRKHTGYLSKTEHAVG